MRLYEPPDREAIWAALDALLQSKLGSSYVTMGRTLVQPPNLTQEYQPALFLVDVQENKMPRPQGLPGKLTLAAFIIIYFQGPLPLMENIGAETISGSTIVNGLLRGVDLALQPDSPTTGKLTLGGLVEHCWIEGESQKDPCMYSQQGAAIIPIRILVP